VDHPASDHSPQPAPDIEPDVQISRIRLSDKTSRLCSRVQRLLQFRKLRDEGDWY
jgi:hypothetical protein